MFYIERLLANKKVSWSIVFSIVSIVIVINVMLSIKTIDDLSVAQKSMANTGEIILSLDKLHNLVLSAETGQRGYLLTENEDFLQPYQNAIDHVLKQIKLVQSLKSDIGIQANKITELTNLVEMKMIELSATVDLALDDKEKRAVSIVMTGRGKDLYKKMEKLFNEVKSREILYRNSLYKKLETIKTEAKFTFNVSAITSFLLLLGLGALVRLNNRNELRHRQSLEAKNEELTEKVKLRTKELTIYSEELARSNRELEDFAFVASHDLQEPLRKIRAFGDRLSSNYNEVIDERGLDFIERMRNAAERMSNLISDLLEYSRINTRGKAFAAVPLTQIITDVIDDLEVSIEESSAIIEYQDLPEINGDISQLNQLFLNLLSNAIKFRQENKIPKINISHSHESVFDSILNADILWNIITVRDNGIGFDQEFEDKIFVPFQRLHARSAYKGTGIGLAVCRRIVERHGGTIDVRSEIGKGTCFTIRIPQNYIAPNNLNVINEL
ncbi:ATP-binding protein [Colwellia sp. 4_MG-2023]|uniref:sensor histidine kinase n=1 Tax=unclassified Colwellia TaxID=196834 RepID=UPI0026E17B5E|nr:MULTISPECIES: sensor histidine kinase [unclassified Colwellia]MDO6507768.1 ATP-binding protein [Colwellia sp. 5_MG-2023]MDO6556371.1 ATP-binding protein [Colwellia sp. 4_MG-2023]